MFPVQNKVEKMIFGFNFSFCVEAIIKKPKLGKSHTGSRVYFVGETGVRAKCDGLSLP